MTRACLAVEEIASPKTVSDYTLQNVASRASTGKRHGMRRDGEKRERRRRNQSGRQRSINRFNGVCPRTLSWRLEPVAGCTVRDSAVEFNGPSRLTTSAGSRIQASVMTVREDAQLLAAAQLVAIGRGPMTVFPHSLVLDPHLLVSTLPVHSSL